MHQQLGVFIADMLSKAVEIMNFYIRQCIDSIRLELVKFNQELLLKPIAPNLIRAAILIPITIRDNELVILFTKRTNSVNSHRNQISFPGGALDKRDANPLAAALRETEEEIGIKKKDIEIFGELEARNTTTGFYMYPFVGFVHSLDGIRINKIEVERIIYIPLIWLRNPINSCVEIYKEQNKRGHPIIAFSNYEGEKVWGITASIIMQFLEIIRK